MRVQRVKVLVSFVILGLLVAVLFLHRTPSASTVIHSQKRLNSTIEKLLEHNEQLKNSDNSIPYHLKETTARNGCVCEGDTRSFNVPFSDLLFPRVGAAALHTAFRETELEEIKKRRHHEYNSFLRRSNTAANLLIIAEANIPLQYPIQGLQVRPKKSTLIPGLGLKLKSRKVYSVNFVASMGTFDVAALVENVHINGEGTMHMNLSSPLLSALNRQLQFVTYTNIIFHPSTADIVQFRTHGFQASFTIKIQHEFTPKLYDPGPTGPKGEYNIDTLVTIATKTFLRYDKLQDLIDSIRQFYPTVTIVIADDSEHPKPVTGPYIEHYIMPYRKGWFAGRNLAVSQVTTKYVLWVDDDFIFTSNTKLEKMVDVLESTSLDLVGGAVREVTGYTATYRHTISTEKGEEDGDCLHIRKGFYHVLEGFPNCVVTDAVINFFMARTDKVRQVGFDPRLARIAHIEFFVDGLGVLHVGSCDDVIINHASKIKEMLPFGQSETDKEYSKFRYANTWSNQTALFYFKNHFKCMTSND
ncbi:beta-1,4 N-acetylgalactosaminyltransferase 1-like isoform X2 [Pangasianodon hypophthalmus]|uniref:beta-1,4 N-acetylgalactosaminyltransferase 1-like isoform X2 n=1 Tax=Pangasianodon hypophthalmus TaxID=310915 RepID=UPI002307C977|nr:beta-1,4 N-acetylgalactosaminyltransferase 1-like isoform X2 [Pangasianodon hypophthalmus]